MNLADSILNSFCAELFKFRSTDDHFWDARRQLDTYVEDAFTRQTEDLESQYMPCLLMPDSLQTKENNFKR